MQLFSTVECIGRNLKVNEDEYTVIGLYRQDKTFGRFISSVDKNRIYVPHRFEEAFAVITAVVEVREGLSTVLEKRTADDFERILGASVVVENLGLMAERVLQVRILTLLILLVLVVIQLRKIWVSSVKKTYWKFRNDLKDYYFLDAARINGLNVLLHTVIMLTAAGVFYLVVSKLDFTILVPPEIVPSRLIDIQAFKNGLTEYIIERNTRQPVISQSYSLVKNLSVIAIIDCGIMIVSFQSWLRRRYK